MKTMHLFIYGSRKEASVDAIKTLLITVFSAAVVSNDLATCKYFMLLLRKTKRVPHSHLPSGLKEYVSEISFIPLNKLVAIMEIKICTYNCRGLTSVSFLQ